MRSSEGAWSVSANPESDVVDRLLAIMARLRDPARGCP